MQQTTAVHLLILYKTVSVHDVDWYFSVGDESLLFPNSPGEPFKALRYTNRKENAKCSEQTVIGNTTYF